MSKKGNIPLPGGATKAAPLSSRSGKRYLPSKREIVAGLSAVGLVALVGIGGIIEGVFSLKEGRITPTEIPNPCLSGPTESLAHVGDIEPTFYHPGSLARVEFTDPDTIIVVDSTGQQFPRDLGPQPQFVKFTEDSANLLLLPTEIITITLLSPGTFQVEHSCPGKEIR